MDEIPDERVRLRAYALWEQAGRPDAKSLEHWLQAQADIAAEDQQQAETMRVVIDGRDYMVAVIGFGEPGS
jgi:hypothetical protein